jgi:hypothetical protein
VSRLSLVIVVVVVALVVVAVEEVVSVVVVGVVGAVTVVAVVMVGLALVETVVSEVVVMVLVVRLGSASVCEREGDQPLPPTLPPPTVSQQCHRSVTVSYYCYSSLESHKIRFISVKSSESGRVTSEYGVRKERFWLYK